MSVLQQGLRKLGRPICRGYSVASVSTVVGADRWRRPLDRNIVLIDGVRTPFMIAGTKFAQHEVDAVELAKTSLIELHNRTGLSMDQIQYIVLGNVISEVSYNNIARNAALVAGYPAIIPGHTVNMACMSSIQSITSCVSLMRSSPLEVCVAGGTDYMSDLPIRIPTKIRRALIKARRAKSTWKKVMMVAKSSMSTLVPEIPHPMEYINDELAVVSAQRLGIMMNVSRQEQDEFALRSQLLSAKAYDEGHITDVVPVKLEGRSEVFNRDNGIRQTSLEQLMRLKPAYPDSAPDPTMTAGNCTFPTDGASACLLMTEERAKALGLKAKIYIRDFIYVAQNPLELPMSGGVFAIPALLERCGLTIKDIDVWETLEDFAAQVVGNLKAMDSDVFAQKYMNRSEKIGVPPIESLNTWGGSLAMGHPFSATGVRLLMHAANRLIYEDKRFAVISACAIGGQGSAVIVERHPDS